jgi:acetoin utilization deacetylase AcuC-like enzyme
MKAKRKTGLVFFPAFDWAISKTHPEREERLLYTQDQVFEEGILDIEGLVEFNPALATADDVERVHFCVPEVDTVITESHYISAGGCKTIAEAVLAGKVDCGFALVRPPGHHAMRVVHGARGFCNINIEAIMVEYIRQTYGVDRVAIVDTDCHHGDGTQDIYWHDPDTLFISLHQDGRTLYPGSGFPKQMGGPNALGTTINIPLPPLTAEAGFLQVIDQLVLPILEEFQPELIINSAGQDNHYNIAVLEGGYSIEGALPYVNVGIILALAGIDYSWVQEPDYDAEKIHQSDQVDRIISSTCEQLLELRQECALKREKHLEGKEFVERSKTVFYDTDGIIEEQKEMVRLCRECAGVIKVDSYADTGYHLLGICVPRKGCKTCQDTGRQWFEEGSVERFNLVCLQDRVADEYQIKRK